MSFTLDLPECLGRAALVGGKAAGLAGLVSSGFLVPPGFCVTTEAYRAAVRAGEFQDAIDSELRLVDHRRDNSDVSARIGKLFSTLRLPPEVAEAIAAGYARLGEGAHVAVRSSATAEDLADASFAGQQDTYLHVRGRQEVLDHVVRCWASLFSPQVLGYRSRFGVDGTDLAMAVVVQSMVPAEAAGVMMTLHPVTGDRSRIFIEAGFGLGEGVVRGDVGTDRFEVEKSTLAILDTSVNPKAQAHRYVEAAGAVQLVSVPERDQGLPCLSQDEVREVARLGARIEEAFGAPMDVEWALGPATGADRQVFLLQARPETVWSRREDPAAIEEFESWDPLHSDSRPEEHWTRTNVGEAMPGVLTPLGWTFWGSNAERAFRGVIADMGVLTRAERAVPADPNTWTIRPFYGRIGWQVDFFATVGDRMPGTSAEKAALSLLGRVPSTLASNPTRRFYGRVATSMPRVLLGSAREVRRTSAEPDDWYRRTIPTLPQLDLSAARTLLNEAGRVFVRVLTAQGHMTFAVIQPLYEAVEALALRTGVGDAGSLSGWGGAETGMLTDLWLASRGQLDMAELLLRHGYHGPEEGEASSRSWREDPAPLRRMLDSYAEHGEDDSPAARDAAARRTYERTVAEVVAAVPSWQRPAVRSLLALAGRFIPQRGIPKRGMLQSIDVCRGVARRMGELLVADGSLADVEDVFYLTFAELGGTLPAGLEDLVVRRRTRRELYLTLVIPSDWRGMPTPADAEADAAATREAVAGVATVSGIGVAGSSRGGRGSSTAPTSVRCSPAKSWSPRPPTRAGRRSCSSPLPWSSTSAVRSATPRWSPASSACRAWSTPGWGPASSPPAT